MGDDYWVVDGHNRVAAALYSGQVEIDAVVEDLRLPGMAVEPRQPIAAVLQGSLDVREAGAGRLTRTTARPAGLPPGRQPDGLVDERPAGDSAPPAIEPEE